MRRFNSKRFDLCAFYFRMEIRVGIIIFNNDM